MKRKWWIVGVLAVLELAVCASIVGLLWTGRSALRGVRFFYITDTYVEETLEETFVVDGPAILDVDVPGDDVTVTGGAEGEIHVVAQLRLWGEDEEDARRQMEVKMTQEGNRVIVRVEYVQRIYALTFNRGSELELEVQVPDGTQLLVATSSGDLVVSDVVGAADLECTSGKIEVERFDGEMKAKASSGDIGLKDLTNGGEMVVESTSGYVTLKDIEADAASIDASSGDVTVSSLEAAGHVTVGTSSGHIELREIDAGSLYVDVSSGGVQLADLTIAGDVDIETSSGDVAMESFTAASLKIRGRSSRIEIGSGTMDGDLDVENTSSNLSVVGVEAASYRLVSSSGDVSLDGCRGALNLRTTAGTIKVEDAAAVQLEIETSSGGVRFSGSLDAEGYHSVKSTSGEVWLMLPSDSTLDVDIATTSGDISTDFTIEMDSFSDHRVAGKINGGGASLEIKASSGDVTLTSVD